MLSKERRRFGFDFINGKHKGGGGGGGIVQKSGCENSVIPQCIVNTRHFLEYTCPPSFYVRQSLDPHSAQKIIVSVDDIIATGSAT